jgi:hypothetical protein
LVLSVCLLHGTAHAALGAQDDLEYVIYRLREAWPDVHVHLRGDSGFGTPAMAPRHQPTCQPPLLDLKGPELLAGDVVTIEPGLYRKDLGGVRVEDMVVIAEQGCENLNQLPEGLAWK